MNKQEPDLNKVYQKIQELLSKRGQAVTVLEEQVDIEMQKEYFNFSKELNKTLDKNLVLKEKDLLFEETTSIEKKKELLSALAKIDNPEAYRAIETYKENSDDELKQWSTLAIQESKMVLETSLLGEAPIFISTGLGGKGNKLRYFLVLVNKEEVSFQDWQKSLIQKELDFELKKEDGELEGVEFDEDKVLVKTLLPISVSIKDVFTRAIKECNELGDFLMESFIVTNIKILESEEIDKLVQEYRSKNNEELDE